MMFLDSSETAMETMFLIPLYRFNLLKKQSVIGGKRTNMLLNML